MPLLPHTRHTLLLELARHDHGAWGEFLAVYERAIRAYAHTLGLQASDVDDVTQEVLAAVHQRIPTWDHDASRGSFRAWLFRVTRNVAIDLVSARTRRGATNVDAALDHVGDRAASRAAHEATLDDAYRRAVLDRAAEQVQQEVSRAAWDAFTLTAVHGQSADVVAEALGMSVGGVYTAKCRVLARLRERADAIDATGDAASVAHPRASTGAGADGG